MYSESDADLQGKKSHLNEDGVQFLDVVTLPVTGLTRPHVWQQREENTELHLSLLAAGNK